MFLRSTPLVAFLGPVAQACTHPARRDDHPEVEHPSNRHDGGTNHGTHHCPDTYAIGRVPRLAARRERYPCLGLHTSIASRRRIGRKRRKSLPAIETIGRWVGKGATTRSEVIMGAFTAVVGKGGEPFAHAVNHDSPRSPDCTPVHPLTAGIAADRLGSRWGFDAEHDGVESVP